MNSEFICRSEWFKPSWYCVLCNYQLAFYQLWSLWSMTTHIRLFISSRSSHDKRREALWHWRINQPEICSGSVAVVDSSNDPSAKNLLRIRRHQLQRRSVRKGSVSATSSQSIFWGSSLHHHQDLWIIFCCKQQRLQRGGNQVWERVTTLNFGLLMVAECHSTNCSTLIALWRLVCWCSVRTLGISYAASNEPQDRYLGRSEYDVKGWQEPGVVAAREAVLGPSTALV